MNRCAPQALSFNTKDTKNTKIAKGLVERAFASFVLFVVQSDACGAAVLANARTL